VGGLLADRKREASRTRDVVVADRRPFPPPQEHQLMSITRTLAATLAAGAIIAPAASAQPADMHASTAQAAAAEQQPKQDLRSADARDAAQNPRGVADTARPPAAQPITPAPVAEAPDSGGINWTTIWIGIAGSLVAVSGLALLVGRSRRIPRLGTGG